MSNSITSPYRLRPIREQDNAELAALIRQVMREHKIDRPGSVYTDPTTDRLFELFQHQNACYWVLEKDGDILGGCGIFPTEALPSGCAELVKLYLDASLRGLGFGEQLMRVCIEEAQNMGYESIYLESMPELSKAIGLYEKLGFTALDKAMGNSGHFACNVWMLLKLSNYSPTLK